MALNDIKDQLKIAQLIESAIENNHLAHALLFTGPQGSSQMEVARELAKTLLCGQRKQIASCDHCADCLQMSQQSHPDFHVLEPEGPTQTIKIDVIRQMLYQVALKPYSAGRKVFVIDQAQTLNEVAQNAILKTLEEPPASTTFILICHAPEKLLATVRSRCQVYVFAESASGQLAQDPQWVMLKHQVLEFVCYKLTGVDALWQGPDLSRLERKDLALLMDEAISYIRLALLFKIGAALSDSPGPAQMTALRQIAGQLSSQQCMETIELLAQFRGLMLESANVKLAFMNLWSRLESISGKERLNAR